MQIGLCVDIDSTHFSDAISNPFNSLGHAPSMPGEKNQRNPIAFNEGHFPAGFAFCFPAARLSSGWWFGGLMLKIGRAHV